MASASPCLPVPGDADLLIRHASGTRVARPGPTLSNHDSTLHSGTDWRELIVSLLLAAVVGVFTVYGLAHFVSAMMCGFRGSEDVRRLEHNPKDELLHKTATPKSD